MTDKELWIMIRRALLMVVDAIERRWALGKYAKGVIIEPTEHDSVSVA